MENMNTNILYENTVLINPRMFFGFKKNKPIKITVENDKIIFHTEPATIIPFNQIKYLKHNYWFDSAFKIYLNDGKIYRVVWASEDKKMRYSVMETSDIFNNLKRIIK